MNTDTNANAARAKSVGLLHDLLRDRSFLSSESKTPLRMENTPSGMTDYKLVYNQLLETLQETPDDYERIARLFDDFTARLTGEYSQERVEDATHAIVEFTSLVFGVVPYPYNSSILADLMELASYAGYADAQLLFYAWATLLDCARLVRQYGYDEAVRRTFGVTRRIISNFPEEEWKRFVQLFLGEQTDVEDGKKPIRSGDAVQTTAGGRAKPIRTGTGAGTDEPDTPESEAARPESENTEPAEQQNSGKHGSALSEFAQSDA